MSSNLPSLYAQQFSTNVQLLLQQKSSKLRGCVTEGKYSGEQASPVDQIGAVDMQTPQARFAAKANTNAAVDRRWVLPTSKDLNQLIDSFDKLKMIADPTSAYVQNAVAAANRAIDDLIIDAMFATAATGKSGSTSTAFTAGNVIASGSGGLTLAKLRNAKKILMANQVDLDSDQIFCVITAEQHDDLFSETQIVSMDYNTKPVLVDGKISSFMGINFVHCERLDLDTGERAVPVFAKSGMHLGIWGEIENSVSKRYDLSSEPWQLYTKLTAGATRLEEKKVVKILCAE
jgi:hypothetical protein